MAYAELACATNFSFLRGASHPEELVAQAISLGLSGLGIADINSVAGVVRAHVFVRENKETAGAFRTLSGARLVFADTTPDILAYPRDRAAWGRLCRLLTKGNLRAKKGHCLLTSQDLLGHAEGLSLVIMEGPCDSALLARLQEASGGHARLAVCPSYGPQMRNAFARKLAFASACGLPALAVNDVLMHGPERREILDVVTCIREHVPLDHAGTLLSRNAERHLKPPMEMARLFAEAPQAITETQKFIDEISFTLDQLAYEYPDELRQGFESEQAALEAFTFEGAARRYPEGVPPRIAGILQHELRLIDELGYAAYFLTVHDIVRYARGIGILAQGRGSAANSSVCFCLGITEVDPIKHELLFERFISAERREPPDIDVDFEHERREEVIQYIYKRYGRERAGLAASVTTYRGKSAIREVGKAFGFTEDMVSALSGTVWGGHGPMEQAEVSRLGFDANEPRLAKAIALADEIGGFPRHLSQHTGGFVITRGRLDEVVPIMPAAMEERTTVEWDKDDLDALGILKIDVLALGMLTCLRKGLDLLSRHYGQTLMLSTIPAEERCVYDMISAADTIGVFQIESRAQMSMLPRLKPARFYDLVIEVAIVRPGPIQGDMVHPYLRRRQGLEPVSYPSQELENVLGRTLGVPLFQEQAMKIAIVAAGFTPGEADKLRRAMATFKRVGTIGTFQTKMVEGMVARGYQRDFAERCFKQIEGFGTYGFPESHAASFALLVYASSWMKCRYPDVFCAALLNAQPMGFYAPSQIIRDAREHGVEIREIDVNRSFWDNTLELLTALILRSGPAQPGGVSKDEETAKPKIHPRHAASADAICTAHAVRLGFRQIKGLREDDMHKLAARRGAGFDSVRDVWLRTGLSPAVLEHLAEADAFAGLGLNRRDALWAVRGLNRAGDKDDLPLLAPLAFEAQEADAHLPPMPPGEEVIEDYRHLHFSLKAHPVSFLRHELARRGILRNEQLANTKSGSLVTVSGLVLVRQRPGTAKGVIFMTLEDESGVCNIIVWPKTFERLRPIVLGARFVCVKGRMQNEAGVIHVIADRMEDLTPLMGLLSRRGGEATSLARADEVSRPQSPRDRSETAQARREALQTRRVLPKGRNFQ